MGLEIDEARTDTLKAALGSFASGVNVITIRDGSGTAHGMTANAFSAVSLDPLLVLICVNRDTRTYEQIRSQGRFGVNILSTEAREISDYCARPGHDKSLDERWLLPESEDGKAPALDGALAFLDCTVHSEVHGGTHAVFLGRVEHVGTNDDDTEPLVYFRGGYQLLDRATSLAS